MSTRTTQNPFGLILQVTRHVTCIQCERDFTKLALVSAAMLALHHSTEP